MKETVKGIIALIVVIAVTGGIFAYETIEKSILREGDFAEIYYIGYFENGTVFSSSFKENISFDTPFDNKNYELTPLKIYFGKGWPDKYPKGWDYGDIGKIEEWRIDEIVGLYEGMKGMKKGEERIIELEPSKAFGLPVEEGVKFNTFYILGFNATFEVSEVGGTTITVKWLPKIGQVITMPQYWYDLFIENPYWIWENSTEVVSYNETHVILRTTPNKLENLSIPFLPWEEAAKAEYNETKIKIIITPPLGNFTMSYGPYTIYGKVLNITEEKIKVIFYFGNRSIEEEMNRTIIFDRELSLPITFNVQKTMVEDELRKKGYSFHELAGKKIIFRVKLLKIYRIS